MKRRGAGLAGAIAVMLLALGGCQPKPRPSTVGNFRTVTGQGGATAPQVLSNPNVETTEFKDLDPCAGRLHDIEGQLLNYYVQKHHWPDNIQELRGYADPGEETDYTCPVSHQPYVYVRGGLVRPGKSQRLMVYDATPAHNGMRYGIAVIYPEGRQALHFDVIGIPEPLFANYKPAPAIQPATLPSAAPRRNQ
ncbi:MAG TPA: hypothetical protein VN541_20220 [Tepidisphaeraceae bacterium]|nr:hypothetical protein [Tepidisphaeraceae bacterium]